MTSNFKKTILQGRCVYNGPKQSTSIFFRDIGYPCRENYNPADHYIWETSVIEGQEEKCKLKIKEICDGYEKNEIFTQLKKGQCAEISTDSNVTEYIKSWDSNRVGFFTSFWWLLWRSLISQVT